MYIFISCCSVVYKIGLCREIDRSRCDDQREWETGRRKTYSLQHPRGWQINRKTVRLCVRDRDDNTTMTRGGAYYISCDDMNAARSRIMYAKGRNTRNYVNVGRTQHRSSTIILRATIVTGELYYYYYYYYRQNLCLFREECVRRGRICVYLYYLYK